MFFVAVQPEPLAAGNLRGSNSTVNAANAAAPTTEVIPAADEVSALTATQLAAHVEMYQLVNAQAEAETRYDLLVCIRRPSPPIRCRLLGDV
jgi:hypothetical protein